MHCCGALWDKEPAIKLVRASVGASAKTSPAIDSSRECSPSLPSSFLWGSTSFTAYCTLSGLCSLAGRMHQRRWQHCIPNRYRPHRHRRSRGRRHGRSVIGHESSSSSVLLFWSSLATSVRKVLFSKGRRAAAAVADTRSHRTNHWTAEIPKKSHLAPRTSPFFLSMFRHLHRFRHTGFFGFVLFSFRRFGFVRF